MKKLLIALLLFASFPTFGQVLTDAQVRDTIAVKLANNNTRKINEKTFRDVLTTLLNYTNQIATGTPIDLSGFAEKDTLAAFAPKDTLATFAKLSNLSPLARKDTLSAFAKIAQLSDYATNAALAGKQNVLGFTPANAATVTAGLAVKADTATTGSLSRTRTPYATSTALRAGSVGTPDVVILSDKQGEAFRYNPANTTLLDDSVMTIRIGNRRYERVDRNITFEMFGVSNQTDYANESVAMQKAVNYLKKIGGGTIHLGEKIYYGNISWAGSDNISIRGKGATKSAIYGAIANEFAIKVTGGFPTNGVSISDCRITGINGDRHGIYLNCGSYYTFDRVKIDNCIIGVLSNGTIDNSFTNCVIRENRIGVMITTLNSGFTSINLGTGASYTATVAFTDTQPAEQTFTNCQFSSNKCHLYIDSKGSAFRASANIKISNGAMQASTCGIYVNQEIRYTEFPLVIDGVWLENYQAGAVPFDFNGHSLPVSDLYSKGGRISVRNTGFSILHAAGNSVIDIDGGYFFTADVTLTEQASIIGKNVSGPHGFVPAYLESGVNMLENDKGFSFYTTPKNIKSRAYSQNKIYSQTHDSTSTLGGKFLGTETIARANGGYFDGKCWQVDLPATNGGLTAPVSVVNGKYYVTIIGIRSTGSAFNMQLFTSNGTAQFLNNTFQVTGEWKPVAVVSRAINTASDSVWLKNGTGAAQQIQVSGWQILAFNTVGEMYQFLKSNSFAL